MAKNGGTIFFVVRGGHEAGRLVIQEHARFFGDWQRSAVYDDSVGWPNGECWRVEHLAVNAHSAVGDPAFGIAARAQSRACNDFGYARFFGLVRGHWGSIRGLRGSVGSVVAGISREAHFRRK